MQVKMWLTLNEPLTMCVDSYGLGSKAPNVKSDGRADYLCAHTSLNAHASAYRLYQEKFAEQGGMLEIGLSWLEFDVIIWILYMSQPEYIRWSEFGIFNQHF